MYAIKEQYKIPLISLSKAIEDKEITVTQAFKEAQSKMEFEGTFVDFIEMMKKEGLIDKDLKSKNSDKKSKVVKVAKVAAIVLLTVAVFKIVNKK
jgi:hypothetical protein